MHYTIHRFDAVTSTNDVAARLASEGAPEGTVVVAGTQSAGRGRQGRSWSSQAGCGLFTSFLLRPGLPREELWQIGFVSAVAVARAVGLHAGVKWPNDILVNGRKICGILVESRTCGLIVGIGINVRQRSFPPELAHATSIAIERGDDTITTEEVLLDLLARFSECYEERFTSGWPATLAAWRALDCTAGRVVSVHTPEGMIAGQAVGVDDDGSLLMRTDDGTLRTIIAGEVLLRGDLTQL